MPILCSTSTSGMAEAPTRLQYRPLSGMPELRSRWYVLRVHVCTCVHGYSQCVTVVLGNLTRMVYFELTLVRLGPMCIALALRICCRRQQALEITPGGPQHIIVYGQSLGSHPSCKLATHSHVAGVVIHSGVASGMQVCKSI